MRYPAYRLFYTQTLSKQLITLELVLHVLDQLCTYFVLIIWLCWKGFYLYLFYLFHTFSNVELDHLEIFHFWHNHFLECSISQSVSQFRHSSNIGNCNCAFVLIRYVFAVDSYRSSSLFYMYVESSSTYYFMCFHSLLFCTWIRIDAW